MHSSPIILLDIEMPIMDGLTAIRRIRALQQEGLAVAHVPVIAVTANARQEHVAKALEAGMDAVVAKPFRIPDLMGRMREVISSVEEREDKEWRNVFG